MLDLTKRRNVMRFEMRRFHEKNMHGKASIFTKALYPEQRDSMAARSVTCD